MSGMWLVLMVTSQVEVLWGKEKGRLAPAGVPGSCPFEERACQARFSFQLLLSGQLEGLCVVPAPSC